LRDRKHLEIKEETHTDLKIFIAQNKLKSFDHALEMLLSNYYINKQSVTNSSTDQLRGK